MPWWLGRGVGWRCDRNFMSCQPPNFLPSWRRMALAFLACAALVLEMVAPHDIAAEQEGVVAKVEIAESAVHPHSPAHFEKGKLKVHPPCVACLLHAQTRTV